MRENRPYGLEGGETGSTGLPYPYATLRFRDSIRPWDFKWQAELKPPNSP
jgi:hypothetical protein